MRLQYADYGNVMVIRWTAAEPGVFKVLFTSRLQGCRLQNPL